MIQASVAEQGKIDLRHRIEARDEGSDVVFIAHFDDAVRVLREGKPV
jgi:hypothetical protein